VVRNARAVLGVVHIVTTAETDRTTPPSGKGARVIFDVHRDVALEPDIAWEALIDWAAHSDWVPLTHVDVDASDPNVFTAWSGPGASGWGRRLALEDRMEAVVVDYEGGYGRCVVHKLGPSLKGVAELTVSPGEVAGTTSIHWHENVTVRRLPRFASSLTGTISAALFGWALGRMEKCARRQH